MKILPWTLTSLLHQTIFHSPFCQLVSVMGLTLEETRRSWAKADAVCFDVDSTLLVDEALDELAKFCGVGKEDHKSDGRRGIL